MKGYVNVLGGKIQASTKPPPSLRAVQAQSAARRGPQKISLPPLKCLEPAPAPGHKNRGAT